jgi:peptide/nickel transport system permease protein
MTVTPDLLETEVMATEVVVGAGVGRRTRVRAATIRPGVAVAGVFLIVVVVAVIWPGLFASGPDNINPIDALQGPSLSHLFGTDQLGRDTFARVVYGARTSVFLGVGPTIAGGVVGAIWGLVAGLGGGVVDEAAMRVADIFMSFPSTLMALLVVAVLGPSTRNVVIAIAVSLAPVFARIVRVQTLVVKDSQYVHAAVSLGVRRRGVVARHVVPNVVGPLLVLLTMNVGTSILAGSSLSFLGLGPQPPTPEWGSMLSQARDYLQSDWALAVFPGLAVTLTVVAVSVVGRQLQARFEGRSLS